MMQVQEIVTRVRSAIDELAANNDFQNGSLDEQNLKDIIIDKIPYALIYIIENAPEEKLDSGMAEALDTSSVSGVTEGSMVSIQLGDDVLRVISARLSSWSLSPIPVSEHSQEYLMQQDEYAKGSWDRPVSAIRHRGANRYIELYSARDSNDTAEVSVIKKPTIGDTSVSTTNIPVPSRLEAAFIYQIAGLTMTAFREPIAQQLFGIAQNYLISGNGINGNDR